MKPSSTYAHLILCLVAAIFIKYGLYHLTTLEETSYDDNDDYPHLQICRNKARENSIHLNYLGPSLVSNSSTDLVLCPGDAFGDLKKTYVIVENCNLAMYHQGNLIWSSNACLDENMLFAVSLDKDGNLIVYKENTISFYSDGQRPLIWPIWDSKTNFNPEKAELRLKDQQLQLVHTLEDGSERLFYARESFREFWEDLGAPRRVAERFLIKNHSDIDNAILRRNEYIGDLKGVHLILQSNCKLELKDSNQTVWSFATYLKPFRECTLCVQGGSSIGISEIPDDDDDYYGGMSILPPNGFTVSQSKITFQGEQLFIIQTLKNGSEIFFYSEPGQDNGLKLKRELRQIAPNNITITSQVTLQRMSYVGDLDGLHLILQDNCHLKLAKGQQDLWKLQENLNDSFMECFVDFKRDGTITFNRLQNEKSHASVQIFGIESYKITRYPSQFRFSLENDMMTILLQYKNESPTIYQATPNTNGTWFQVLSGNSSLIVNANDTDDQILSQMGYLGDINGVYAVLNKRSNWILFNKTKPIWESGTIHDYDSHFVLTLTREGNVAVFNKMYIREKDHCLWSTQSVTGINSVKQESLGSAELLVNNEGLWLIHNYTDGSARKFRAQEGTNNFVPVPNENEFEVSSLSQIHKI